MLSAIYDIKDKSEYKGKSFFLIDQHDNYRKYYMGVLQNIHYYKNKYNMVEYEIRFQDKRIYKTNVNHNCFIQ